MLVQVSHQNESLHALGKIVHVEKSFLQNEGRYKDGLEIQKGKKQGVVMQ